MPVVDPEYLKYLQGHLMHRALFLSGNSSSKYFHTLDEPSFATGRIHPSLSVPDAPSLSVPDAIVAAVKQGEPLADRLSLKFTKSNAEPKTGIVLKTIHRAGAGRCWKVRQPIPATSYCIVGQVDSLKMIHFRGKWLGFCQKCFYR